ncbi:MAG: DUF2917 domain-containing protein [Burkholderiales bacterium]
MDAYRIEDAVAQASIGMTRGKLIRVDDGCGVELAVVCGSVWITQDQDTNDISLDAGESFRIDRDGVTLVSALRPSLVTLTPPPAQDRRLQVSMLGAGAGPVRLLDAGAPRKSTRFDAWLEKFWVRLFVPSARPTTGAL